MYPRQLSTRHVNVHIKLSNLHNVHNKRTHIFTSIRVIKTKSRRRKMTAGNVQNDKLCTGQNAISIHNIILYIFVEMTKF